MARLEYVPSHVGRSLRLGGSSLLGLEVPDVANPFYAELARGVQDVAESCGLNVLLCNTNSVQARADRYADFFRSGVVDGVISASAHGASEIKGLARTLPVVVVNEVADGCEFDAVCTDNEFGGALAGRHLRDLGHREILILDGPRGSPAGELRRRGFVQAFAGASVTLRHRRGDYRGPSAARIIDRELEQRGAWFSAVYAANDLMAVAAVGELRAHGFEVPEDVSVVGYDDSRLAALVTPALTTIRQPVYEMGWVGGERLIAAIRDVDWPGPAQTTLGVELVPRASTAPRAPR